MAGYGEQTAELTGPSSGNAGGAHGRARAASEPGGDAGGPTRHHGPVSGGASAVTATTQSTDAEPVVDAGAGLDYVKLKLLEPQRLNSVEGTAYHAPLGGKRESTNVFSLWHAAKHGNAPRVKELVERIVARRKEEAAAKRGQVVGPTPDAAEVAAGLDGDDREGVNARDEDGGRTALHWVCKSADLPLIKYLLSRGAAINALDMHGSTPLHYCAAWGTPIVCLFLLERGADVNVVNADGRTAEHLARLMGRHDTADLLARWEMPLADASRRPAGASAAPTSIARGTGLPVGGRAQTAPAGGASAPSGSTTTASGGEQRSEQRRAVAPAGSSEREPTREEDIARQREAITVKTALHGEWGTSLLPNLRRLAKLLRRYDEPPAAATAPKWEGGDPARDPLQDLDGAAAAYRRVVGILERAYGAGDGRVGAALADLGEALTEMGAYDEAQGVLERALGILEEAKGSVTMEVAAAALSLAELYERMQLFDLAKPLLLQAMKVQKRVMGEENRCVAPTMSAIGRVCVALGDLDGAADAFRDALKRTATAYGAKALPVAPCCDDLAQTLIAIYNRSQDAFARLENARLAAEHARAVETVMKLRGELPSDDEAEAEADGAGHDGGDEGRGDSQSEGDGELDVSALQTVPGATGSPPRSPSPSKPPVKGAVELSPGTSTTAKRLRTKLEAELQSAAGSPAGTRARAKDLTLVLSDTELASLRRELQTVLQYAVDVRAECLGDTHPDTLRARTNLGVAVVMFSAAPKGGRGDLEAGRLRPSRHAEVKIPAKPKQRGAPVPQVPMPERPRAVLTSLPLKIPAATAFKAVQVESVKKAKEPLTAAQRRRRARVSAAVKEMTAAGEPVPVTLKVVPPTAEATAQRARDLAFEEAVARRKANIKKNASAVGVYSAAQPRPARGKLGRRGRSRKQR